jgi:hypothetical protein
VRELDKKRQFAMSSPEVWYRYLRAYDGSISLFESSNEENKKIQLQELKVIKTTPKGVWLFDERFYKDRFVLFDSHKQYACKTIEEAKTSFLKRRLKQIEILKGQLKVAETDLHAAQKDQWQSVKKSAL